MNNFAENPQMPIGLGLALAQNLNAMNRFASLSLQQKQQIIEQTHQINSKQEMRALVEKIARNEMDWSQPGTSS